MSLNELSKNLAFLFLKSVKFINCKKKTINKIFYFYKPNFGKYLIKLKLKFSLH